MERTRKQSIVDMKMGLLLKSGLHTKMEHKNSEKRRTQQTVKWIRKTERTGECMHKVNT